MDREILELERLARASPDDAALALRLAGALARAGEVERAALEAARVVDADPGDREALRLLDGLAPGGVEPLAGWAGGQGNPRRTMRSPLAGPTKGNVAARIELERDLDLRFDAAVDARGRLLIADPREGPRRRGLLEADLNFEFLVEVEEEAPAPFADRGRIVSIDLDGRTFVTDLPGGGVQLLAGWSLVADRDDVVAVGRHGLTTFQPGGAWIAGLGNLVGTWNGRLEARPLGRPDSPRWSVRMAPRALALGPGATVVAVAKDRLAVHDLADGSLLSEVALAADMASELLVAADGTAFIGAHACAAVRGEVLWRGSGRPLALAGAEDVLIARGEAVVALEVATGRELWRRKDEFHGSPRVDARGLIYWRTADSIVVLEPRSGKTVAETSIVGEGGRDVAFLPGERAVLLRRAGPTRTELIVLE